MTTPDANAVRPEIATPAQAAAEPPSAEGEAAAEPASSPEASAAASTLILDVTKPESWALTSDVPPREMLACVRALMRSPGLRAIALERHRQLDAEGYSLEHDARHGYLALLFASLAYGLTACGTPADTARQVWPWKKAGFKPTTPIRDMAKSGALDAAALDVALMPVDPSEA